MYKSSWVDLGNNNGVNLSNTPQLSLTLSLLTSTTAPPLTLSLPIHSTTPSHNHYEDDLYGLAFPKSANVSTFTATMSTTDGNSPNMNNPLMSIYLKKPTQVENPLYKTLLTQWARDRARVVISHQIKSVSRLYYTVVNNKTTLSNLTNPNSILVAGMNIDQIEYLQNMFMHASNQRSQYNNSRNGSNHNNNNINTNDKTKSSSSSYFGFLS
jgi:hypothetical protein